MVKKHVCFPRSFLVINICNQGKTLCSPCMSADVSTLGDHFQFNLKAISMVLNKPYFYVWSRQEIFETVYLKKCNNKACRTLI